MATHPPHDPRQTPRKPPPGAPPRRRRRPPPPGGRKVARPVRVAPPRAVKRRVLSDRIRIFTLWPLVFGLGYFLLFAPVMRVTQLVPLNSQFTEDELNSNFNWDAWKGEYIWSLWWNRAPLIAMLNDHPRVDYVTTRYVFPGRLEVIFREKERYASIVHGPQAIIIASDYTFMGIERADRVAATRLMSGLDPSFLFDKDGEPLDDPFPIWPPQPTPEEQGRYYYAKLLQLWKWIDAESNPPLSQVAALTVDAERGITLHYKSGGDHLHPPILLGYGPELELKYGQALTVYRSGRWREADNVEIDLRFDRNVVRTIPADAPLFNWQQLAWLPRDLRPALPARESRTITLAEPLLTAPREE